MQFLKMSAELEIQVKKYEPIAIDRIRCESIKIFKKRTEKNAAKPVRIKIV